MAAAAATAAAIAPALKPPEALSFAASSEPADFGSSSAIVLTETIGITSASK